MSTNEQGLHSGRFSVIPSRALDDPRMTPTLLRLLNVLGTHGDTDGYCWPKLMTISKRMGNVSKSAISQGLKKLHDMGYLEISPRYGDEGERKTNMYRILFDGKLPQLNSRQPQELNGGLAPELNGGLAPELNTLNVPSERPRLTLPSAAAITPNPREQINGGMPAAAAEEHKNDQLAETTEAVRRHLHMDRSKTPGLRLIVAQYPDARAWLENQANLCFESLTVRPLQLKHFSNWLDESERRRNTPREESTHDESTAATTHRDPDKLTDDEREAIKAELNARVARLFGANAGG